MPVPIRQYLCACACTMQAHAHAHALNAHALNEAHANANTHIHVQVRQRSGALWEHTRAECSDVLSIHYPDDSAASRSGSRSSHRPSSPEGLLSYRLLESLLPVPQHKILVCLIEKNGLTAQAVLFAGLLGAHNTSKVNKMIESGTVPQGTNWLKVQYTKMIESPVEFMATATARLLSPNWRKVVVLRHPVERFVSAYRDKCVTELALWKSNAPHSDVRCLRVFRLDVANVSIKAVAERLHLGAADPHWAPQSTFCGGLSATRGQYQRVMFGEMAKELPSLLRRWGLPSAVVLRAAKLLQTSYTSERNRGQYSHRTNTVLDTINAGSDTGAALMSKVTRQQVEWFYRDDFPLIGLPRPKSPRPLVALQGPLRKVAVDSS